MNFFLNLITRNRPLVILVVLSSLSFLSLAIGAESSVLRQGLARAVSLTAYPILKSQDAAVRSTKYVYGLFLNYDTVLGENQRLKEEAVRMKTVMAERNELHAENSRLRAQLNFVESDSRLSLQPARIIESFKGTLTIDQGRFHGIDRSMPVISDRGVVGLVIETNDFSAIVATLHHAECKIGAMVQRNRLRAYDGVIHASGSNWSHLCTMEYIDMKEDVRVGDMVVTSPESVFPAGYPVGTVSRVYQTGSLWKTAEITPFVDPYSLDEVYVVRRAAPDPTVLAGVERQIRAQSMAPQQPDMRTIQEKLAP